MVEKTQLIDNVGVNEVIKTVFVNMHMYVSDISPKKEYATLLFLKVTFVNTYVSLFASAFAYRI